MKKFMFDLKEDVAEADCSYVVRGRNVGDEEIAIGDILYGLKVMRIEFWNQVDVPLPPTYSGQLTLSWEHRPKSGRERSFLVSIEGEWTQKTEAHVEN
jgi:hypothetical protein